MTAVADLRQQKSTTVRFFSAPPAMRAAFRVLNRAAPALAARWAERIWFTLPRSPAPPEAVPAPGGHRFTVDVKGRRLVGEVWGTGSAVYLMHGWGGNAGQLAAFVAPLVDRGHRVVAFDAPSHGRSDPGAYGPRSSSIPEFATALTAVVAAHGPAHAVIAHSMGGTAAAVALCDGLRADRVALLAPMASPVAYARQLADYLGFGEPTYRRLIVRVERRVRAPMHHFDVPELGRAVAMPPTLVVHDRDDAFTPVTDGAAIAAAWPSARMRVTAGLGHQRLLRDPKVVSEVVDFVAR
ncbi:MAG TPA: alpha/beta fold hydrolase [Actinoplanes sp.]|jgi:pimeloyl-ACP methyl ester carboxylesterase|nr:alpha/beta fold hydrolase [Actinoplanes sp.]